MGWARTLLLGDIGNRLDIADTETEISDLRNRLHLMRSERKRNDQRQDAQLAEARERIDELEEEVDDLKVYVTGLSELLVAHAGVPREKVQRLVGAVDPGETPRPS